MAEQRAVTAAVVQRGAPVPSPAPARHSLSQDAAAASRFRWAQVRLLADFHRLNRREITLRWGEAADGIVALARRRARTVADRVRLEQGVAVQVTPTMKVRAMDGQPLPASAFNVRATTNF